MGNEGDATPFTDVTVEDISTMLHNCGYQSTGWEAMYNGHTGQQQHSGLTGAYAQGISSSVCALHARLCVCVRTYAHASMSIDSCDQEGYAFGEQNAPSLSFSRSMWVPLVHQH